MRTSFTPAIVTFVLASADATALAQHRPASMPTPVASIEAHVVTGGGSVPGSPGPPQLSTYCPESSFRSASFSYEETIDENGRAGGFKFLKKPLLSSPCPAFLNAYRRWALSTRHEPVRTDGRPTAVFHTVSVNLHFH